jgi:hypothetical protein
MGLMRRTQRLCWGDSTKVLMEKDVEASQNPL